MNKLFIALLSWICCYGGISAQTQMDYKYLSQANEKTKFLHDPHERISYPSFEQTKSPGIFLLNSYKLIVAEQLSTGCIYKITCSDFMRHAIRDYGFFKGFFLGIDRLTRCNNISVKDVPAYKFDEQNRLIDDNTQSYVF